MFKNFGLNIVFENM